MAIHFMEGYIRLSNIPGTLSGDILRLHRNLPNLSDNWDIDGDVITKIESVPTPPEEKGFHQARSHLC